MSGFENMIKNAITDNIKMRTIADEDGWSQPFHFTRFKIAGIEMYPKKTREDCVVYLVAITHKKNKDDRKNVTVFEVYHYLKHNVLNVMFDGHATVDLDAGKVHDSTVCYGGFTYEDGIAFLERTFKKE